MFARMHGATRPNLIHQMCRHSSWHWHPQTLTVTLQSRSFHALSGQPTLVQTARKGKDCFSGQLEPMVQKCTQLAADPCCIMQTRTFSLAAYLGPDFLPIKCAQQVLETIHDTVGLPWWASIILSTFIMRTLVTFPLAAYAHYNSARVTNVKAEIQETAKELKVEVDVAAQKYQWNENKAKFYFHLNMKRLQREAYIRENCHPFKSIMVLLTQVPLWYSFSLGLRNLAGALQIPGEELGVLRPDMGSEGALWFSNLLVPDPYFILPCLMCLSSLMLIEITTWQPPPVGNPLGQRLILTAMRIWSFVMLPIGAAVPSCMSLYWCCSMMYGVGQNLFLRHPRVRQAFRIPRTKKDTDSPYRDMWKFAKEKYSGKAERTQQGWQRLRSNPVTVLRHSAKDMTVGRLQRIKNWRQPKGVTENTTKVAAEDLKAVSARNSRKGGGGGLDKPS